MTDRYTGRIICTISERIDEDGTSDFPKMLTDHDTATVAAFVDRRAGTTA